MAAFMIKTNLQYQTTFLEYEKYNRPSAEVLEDILRREFPDATYKFMDDIITFTNQEDLVAFILKYDHIYHDTYYGNLPTI